MNKFEKKSETKQEGDDFTRVERFSLPDVTDGEGISAKANHGVSEVIIPKAEKNGFCKISVEG